MTVLIDLHTLQWNRIARSVAGAAGLDEWDNARLFGLLNMALSDGYVSSFESKHRYSFWRPVTAIHEGDDPRTSGDMDWTPLVGTPPIPDHDSAHTVAGAAAAGVFAPIFGTDDVSFEACSLTLPEGKQCDDAAPPMRSSTSCSQVALENGDSRVLVGFNLRNAVDEGSSAGDSSPCAPSIACCDHSTDAQSSVVATIRRALRVRRS